MTLPQPTRLNGTVVFNTLKLCCQSFSPVSASQQATTSCSSTPAPVRPFAHTRLSKTAGVERPTQLSDQMRFSPSGDQFETNPVSSETPVCPRPRQLGQSFAIAGAAKATKKPARSAATTRCIEPCAAVFIRLSLAENEIRWFVIRVNQNS